MNRLLSETLTDIRIQIRTKLYAIGIFVAVLMAAILSQFITPEQLAFFAPVLVLTSIGTTTMMYVAGMIIFERDEGTLYALIVSPLKSSEYLCSKVLSLTFLATLETVIMIGGTMLVLSRSAEFNIPNIPLLLLGILAVAALHTLIGIAFIVRFKTFVDAIIPLSLVMVPLQLPALYFLGLIEHPAFLIIPSSAPTLIMKGAYVPLTPGEWAYALVYSLLVLAGAMLWAQQAFKRHVIEGVG